jgi:hypothetical protein
LLSIVYAMLYLIIQETGVGLMEEKLRR